MDVQEVIDYLCEKAEAGDLDGVRDALESGAPVNGRLDGVDTNALQLAARKGHFGVVRYLVSEGARVDDTCFGMTAEQHARAAGFPLIEDYLKSFRAPVFPEGELPRHKQEVFGASSGKLAVMDHPRSWERFEEFAKVLGFQGERITKDDLLQTNDAGFCWLGKAAMHGALPQVLRWLQVMDKVPETSELLASQEGVRDGTVLETLVACDAHPALFNAKFWEGKSPAAMQELYRALPESAQAQVSNYHSVLQQVQRQYQQQQSAQGRA